MKFKAETRTRMVARTIGGVTHQVPEKYTENVPVLPRDWDAVATRTASGIVLALTCVAIVWSTISIGGLLGGGVGYAAASIFDLAWLTVLVLEWLARFDPKKRSFPRYAGWFLVVLAAGAIFWHGMLQHSVPLAVVGAAVSVISKTLWLAVFRHIDRPISEADAAWLAAEESRLSAQEAIATVRLRAAAAEERVTLRLLQAERIRGELNTLPAPAAAAVSTGTDTAGELDQVAEDVPVSVALTSPDTVRTSDRAVPSIAALARAQVAARAGDKAAVAAILAVRPDANPDSVLRSVRRARTELDRTRPTGGYL